MARPTTPGQANNRRTADVKTGPGETYRKRTKNGMLMLARGKEQEQEQPELDLVAFGTVEHICYEHDGQLNIKLVRRGTGKQEVQVEWKIENVNVVASSFCEQSGTAVIPAGQFKSEITINLVDNDVWNMEALQLMKLHSPKDCVMGELCTTTIVMLNEDIFPSNVEDEADQAKMVWGFLEHMRAYFPSEFIKGVLLKVYPSFSWVLKRVVLLIVINKLQEADLDDGTLYVMAALFMGNAIIEYSTAEAFHLLRLGGKARTLLRTSILNVNLQLELSAQEDFPSGEVMNLMGVGVENVVLFVWIKFFELWQSVLVMMCMLAMMLYTLYGDLMYMSVFPLAMIGFDIVIFMIRAPSGARAYQEFLKQENLWKQLTVEATELRTTITTYRWGAKICKEFAEQHKSSTKTNYELSGHNMRTMWIVKLVHSGSIGALLIICAHGVSDGNMKIGEFVVLITTMFTTDVQVNAIFTMMIQIVNGYSAILVVSRLLNAHTRRKALLKGQIRRHKLLDTFTDNAKEEGEDFDTKNILFSNVEYSYKDNKGKELYRLGPIDLMLEQGQLIAIQASARGGKQTFLKLLGRVFLPTEGFVWYEENLRVRFLSDRPTIFNVTVLENLQFGNQKKISEKDIWGVCDLLGIGHLKKNGDRPVGHHGEKLSASDRVLITLARALLSSVDLLLLANTLDILEMSRRTNVMKVLKEMIQNRGMAYEIAASKDTCISTRKQKTVIFVTNAEDLEKEASACITFNESNSAPSPLEGNTTDDASAADSEKMQKSSEHDNDVELQTELTTLPTMSPVSVPGLIGFLDSEEITNQRSTSPQELDVAAELKQMQETQASAQEAAGEPKIYQ